MGKHKLLALVMVAVLVLSLTACKSGDDQTNEPTATEAPTATQAPTAEPTAEPTTVPTAAPAPVIEGGPASIDFEDGNLDFAVITTPTLNSDNSQLSVEDVNGSKVLAAINTFQKKEAYIGIDLSALL